jgi:hypothetical protein
MHFRALFSYLTVIIFATFIVNIVNVSAQEINDNYKKLELTNKVLNQSSQEQPVDISNPTATKKSAGISMLLSLVLPGAGHFYIDRMDVGQYFLAADGASWLGLAGVNIYGNIIRDNARTFSVDHAGVNADGKNDTYYANIGNYESIYEYNNAKLSQGEYDKVYSDVDKFFWNWDSKQNFLRYDEQRGESERIKNTSIIFASALVVNRLASALSALLMTNQHNNLLSNIKVNSEVSMSPENRIDGMKLNLIKQF